ncbi:MAG: hypothetical protein C0594_07725 [Marinilabiliales bacterium]|nr:MAG: hypothetical protein C0594_07725 [Marinilabiliales bacterium]
MNSKTLNLSFIIGWIVFISVLSLIPGNSFDPLQTPFWKKIYFDKFIHAGFYFVLNFLLLRRIELKKLNKILFTILFSSFAFAYSGIIELLQGTVIISRNSDMIDLAANFAGITLAIIYFQLRNPVKIK